MSQQCFLDLKAFLISDLSQCVCQLIFAKRLLFGIHCWEGGRLQVIPGNFYMLTINTMKIFNQLTDIHRLGIINQELVAKYNCTTPWLFDFARLRWDFLFAATFDFAKLKPISENYSILFLFHLSETQTQGSVHATLAKKLLRITWSSGTPSTTPVRNPAQKLTFKQHWSPSQRARNPGWCSCLGRPTLFRGKFSLTPRSTWWRNLADTWDSLLDSPSWTSICRLGCFGKSWRIGRKDKLQSFLTWITWEKTPNS